MSNGPVLLGLDASTGVCTVALLQGNAVIARANGEERGHSAILLALADELLAEAGVSRTALDAIVCTRGPGAFTGVRITVGVAQGLAMGLERPVIPFSSLQVVAETARAGHNGDVTGILVLQDARMQEIYGGFYRIGSGMRQETDLSGDEWIGPAQLPDIPLGRWLGAGSGFAAHSDLQNAKGLVAVEHAVSPSIAAVMPSARRRLEAGEVVEAQHIEPTYLRNRVADVPRG